MVGLIGNRGMLDASCSRTLHRAIDDISAQKGVGDPGEANLSRIMRTDARLVGTE